MQRRVRHPLCSQNTDTIRDVHVVHYPTPIAISLYKWMEHCRNYRMFDLRTAFR